MYLYIIKAWSLKLGQFFNRALAAVLEGLGSSLNRASVLLGIVARLCSEVDTRGCIGLLIEHLSDVRAEVTLSQRSCHMP